jgi:hypothetical protein
MFLLQSAVEVLVVAMQYICAQGRSDRARIAVVPIRGHPVGCDAGDHLALAVTMNIGFSRKFRAAAACTFPVKEEDTLDSHPGCCFSCRRLHYP